MALRPSSLGPSLRIAGPPSSPRPFGPGTNFSRGRFVGVDQRSINRTSSIRIMAVVCGGRKDKVRKIARFLGEGGGVVSFECLGLSWASARGELLVLSV